MADETESKQKFVIKEDDIKVFNLSSCFTTSFGESQGVQHPAKLSKPGQENPYIRVKHQGKDGI